MTRTVTVLISLLIVSTANAVDPASTTFSSAGQNVRLVELYTSEGCSSCPPADRWLSRLADDADLWREFVPVAFHVDYWDYLGWPDRFADAAFSRRQRGYYDEGTVSSVYTPGMFVAGQEWTGWRRVDTPAQNRRGPVGLLTASVSGNEVAIDYKHTDSDSGPLVAHVALLGMSLETDVQRGENRGRQLAHDFVVLGATSTPMDAVSRQSTARLSLPVSGHTAERYAVAVWVSAADARRPLQATGGYLSP